MTSANKNNNLPDLTPEAAVCLLSCHLQGKWLSCKVSDVCIKLLQGGFINRVYLVTNKSTQEFVIIRLYGGKQLQSGFSQDPSVLRCIGLEGEVLLCHFMDVNAIGPKILGVFDGGRIEKYVEGNEQTFGSLDDEVTNSIFARKLARMHSLQLPLNKRAKDVLGFIKTSFRDNWDNCFQVIQGIKPATVLFPEQEQLIDMTLKYDFQSLIKYFEQLLPTVGTRVVFCHGDMSRSNFIINENRMDDERVTFLDFEMAGYNLRGSDIGNHFKHRTRDLRKFTRQSATPITMEVEYPDEDERRKFVREYLKEWKRLRGDLFDEKLDNEDNLLLEAEVHDGLHQLFFIAYMIVNPETFSGLGYHPGIYLGVLLLDFEARKTRIQDLQISK